MPDDYPTIMAKQDAIEREKRETRRFWVTTAVASVAALASVAGVILQLLPV